MDPPGRNNNVLVMHEDTIVGEGLAVVLRAQPDLTSVLM